MLTTRLRRGYYNSIANKRLSTLVHLFVLLLVIKSLLPLLAVGGAFTLDAVLDDPRVLLNLLKRNSLLRIQNQ